MKTITQILILSLVTLATVSCRGPQMVTAAQPVATNITMQTFYTELSPYGRWIADPLYGYVWRPNVERGFIPYATRGYWAMTPYGNTWVSDYAWGWAPFHYGRWAFDSFHGWVWVPDTVWGPAWVSWRSGGGYYGWTPLGPGISPHMAFHAPMAHWIFVPQRYITSPRLFNYCVPGGRVTNIYQNTTVINNYYNEGNRTYVQGPRRSEIEQHTGQRVPVYEVSNNSRPGRPELRNGAINVYRPEVAARGNEASAQPVNRQTAPRTDRSIDRSALEDNGAANPAELRRSRSDRPTTIGRSNPTPELRERAPSSRTEGISVGPEGTSRTGRVGSPQEVRRTDARSSRPETMDRPSPSPRIERSPAPRPERAPRPSTESPQRPAAETIRQRPPVQQNQPRPEPRRVEQSRDIQIQDSGVPAGQYGRPRR
ncbi:hypothetical protein BH24BAC1_BH24BAC1_41410 [soil metagenome]